VPPATGHLLDAGLPHPQHLSRVRRRVPNLQQAELAEGVAAPRKEAAIAREARHVVPPHSGLNDDRALERGHQRGPRDDAARLPQPQLPGRVLAPRVQGPRVRDGRAGVLAARHLHDRVLRQGNHFGRLYLRLLAAREVQPVPQPPAEPLAVGVEVAVALLAHRHRLLIVRDVVQDLGVHVVRHNHPLVGQLGHARHRDLVRHRRHAVPRDHGLRAAHVRRAHARKVPRAAEGPHDPLDGVERLQRRRKRPRVLDEPPEEAARVGDGDHGGVDAGDGDDRVRERQPAEPLRPGGKPGRQRLGPAPEDVDAARVGERHGEGRPARHVRHPVLAEPLRRNYRRHRPVDIVVEAELAVGVGAEGVDAAVAQADEGVVRPAARPLRPELPQHRAHARAVLLLDGVVAELPVEPLAPGPHVAGDGDGDGVVAAARDGAGGDTLERGDEAGGGAVGVGGEAELAPRAAPPRVQVARAVERHGVVVACGDGLDVVEAVDEGGDGAAVVALPDAELAVAVAAARHDDAVVGEEKAVVLSQGAHAYDAALQRGDGVWDVEGVQGLVPELAKLPVAPCEYFGIGYVHRFANYSLLGIVTAAFLFFVDGFCAVVVNFCSCIPSRISCLIVIAIPTRIESTCIDVLIARSKRLWWRLKVARPRLLHL